VIVVVTSWDSPVEVEGARDLRRLPQRNALVSPGTDPLAVASALRALTLGLNIQRRFDGSLISVREALSALRGVVMETPPGPS